jgi:hypothetical protein
LQNAPVALEPAKTSTKKYDSYRRCRGKESY